MATNPYLNSLFDLNKWTERAINSNGNKWLIRR